jgi:hypothetical protein
MSLFRNPFSRGYWQASLASFRSLRCQVFAALMMAAAIVLSALSVPVADNLYLTVGFLARALMALVCGPLTALVCGCAEDLLGFLIHPSGPFFPGYTLSTMLGVFVYALCFYRTKITLPRIIAAKTITNYFVNVALGSCWSAILYGKGYLYYMTASLIKNTLYLPVQVLMLAVLFQALLPVLARQRLIPSQMGELTWGLGFARRTAERLSR